MRISGGHSNERGQVGGDLTVIPPASNLESRRMRKRRSARTLGRVWRRLGQRMFARAMALNLSNIRDSVTGLNGEHGLRVLDLGCWDGDTTLGYVPPTWRLFGVEASPSAAQIARSNWIEVIVGDLNGELPVADSSVDVVTSNQVIEHLHDTDKFLSESFRVLRPGGTLVVSTENAASWHNIFALLFGWQSFSLTNVSSRAGGVGNPLANLRAEEPGEKGWQHLRIFSHRGLSELVEAHGFQRVSMAGAGYYPLPAGAGRLDPRHAAFITATGVRPPPGAA